MSSGLGKAVKDPSVVSFISQEKVWRTAVMQSSFKGCSLWIGMRVHN